METRSLGQIWQFTVGLAVTVLSVLLIAALAVMHYALPPPSPQELHPVEGVLVNPVAFDRSMMHPRAIFEIRAPGSTLGAQINNYEYNLLMLCCNTSAIEKLEPGAQITAWFTEKDIAGKTEATVWKMQSAGTDLLTLDQSLCAEHKLELRRFIVAFLILACGAGLIFWGWRIAKFYESVEREESMGTSGSE